MTHGIMLQNWSSEEASAATTGHWIAAQLAQLTAMDFAAVTYAMAAAAAVATLIQNVVSAVAALWHH